MEDYPNSLELTQYTNNTEEFIGYSPIIDIYNQIEFIEMLEDVIYQEWVADNNIECTEREMRATIEIETMAEAERQHNSKIQTKLMNLWIFICSLIGYR